MRFKADKDIMNVLMHLGRKRGRGDGVGGGGSGELVLTTSLWGMFYADDAGVVS